MNDKPSETYNSVHSGTIEDSRKPSTRHDSHQKSIQYITRTLPSGHIESSEFGMRAIEVDTFNNESTIIIKPSKLKLKLDLRAPMKRAIGH